MRLVHYSAAERDTDSKTNTAPAGRGDVLATNVDIADAILSQTRGLMFRRSLPDDYALAFRFDTAKPRDVHMLFVFFPIDAVWIADGVVQRVERLRPWRGFAREECDLLVELPAGTAADVEPGDRLVLESP
ncbi:DUF192 domain-containing protein [Natronorubrum sp. JWXQ-INN-674]|uniref:DUF192 domain-containing protein n=1 Tax=Natronorubrum halalkaliphilum TaxID=2691917 RepID=A0A6B0VMT9_9EURY|nr:DUF192 domain-containing protein [Natronorubrum halalkaliphilum]MXV62485.1 DUF192 domain-containing protein [Natronorubrum halalkaliphilum]